ncbi:hypothetical protein DFO66_102194 [Brevibacterium sanguinis]|uniref:Uncharacterized protein n=2 Tax=Brevibacterium TaxID=1696 RepID=A0A366ILR1_9MICO|nr:MULTISPECIES: hypothetical protein [Brevibacterium]RBP67141.1 hypothetical protein DFO66_102194 [Brevibacterium sanguinis]RBP73666.1 hypothetical protein DFO65_102194 [Brevibacterium celere]
MIVTQIACAIVTVVAGVGALRIGPEATRAQLLGGLLSALVMLLFVRLIVDFGGWVGWFLYVWLAGIALVAGGAARATLRWPDRPARADDPKARRSEVLTNAIAAAFILVLAAVAVALGIVHG